MVMNPIQMKQCQSIIRKACIAVGILAGSVYKDNVYTTNYEIRKVQIRMLIKIGQVFGKKLSKKDAGLELDKYGANVHTYGMNIWIIWNAANAGENIIETRFIGNQFIRKLQIQMAKEDIDITKPDEVK